MSNTPFAGPTKYLLMKIQEARSILKQTGKDMTDKEVKQLINFLDHMTDATLEAFELDVYGKTLNTLLTDYD